MGKRESYNQANQYQAPITRAKKTKNKKKGSSPCMQSFSRNNPTRGVIWQLAVPSWEKQFCVKIGLFNTWEGFLDAKKYSQYYATSTIKNWDDSAAEKAFKHAKTRFLARLGGSDDHDDDDDDDMMMDPNMYIDEIKWDEQVDPDLLEELESAKLPKDYGDDDHVDPDQIQIQDIKATGWDIDVEQVSQSNFLTGLIVGS